MSLELIGKAARFSCCSATMIIGIFRSGKRNGYPPCVGITESEKNVNGGDETNK